MLLMVHLLVGLSLLISCLISVGTDGVLLMVALEFF